VAEVVDAAGAAVTVVDMLELVALLAYGADGRARVEAAITAVIIKDVKVMMKTGW
jgi:hypothetical protein